MSNNYMDKEAMENLLSRLKTLKCLFKMANNITTHIEAYDFLLSLIENIDMQMQLVESKNV